ncbi:MAG: DMT family transporter [Clostridia bacterium]|nr:DMT family transporter [Clostridia bacterium]
MKNKSQSTIGYLEVFAAGCLWGCIGVFMQAMTNLGAGSGLISLMRQGFGCLFLLPVTLISCGGFKSFKIPKKDLLMFLCMGLFSEAIFNLCYSGAVAKVGVATAAVLLYTAPVFVAIMSRIAFSEAITGLKIVALAVNLIGCTLTVTNGDFSGISFAVNGVILGCMAGFFYASLTIFGKFVSEDVPPFVMCTYTFLFGFLFLVGITRPWTMDFSIIPGYAWALGLLLGLLGTAAPYVLYMAGLKKPIEASKVPLVASVETVVAAIMGVAVFKEDLGPMKILGIALVFVSIAIINSSGKKAQ